MFLLVPSKVIPEVLLFFLTKILSLKYPNMKTDKMGNMLALDIVTGDYALTIINLYGPIR